jgi:NifU-like protein involved in Fe-S cluster formation
VNAPVYTPKILRLAAELTPGRALERCDGRAELRSPTCGSTVATSVMLTDDGTVAALSQTVRACAFGQAAAALVERGAAGRSAPEIAMAIEQLSSWLASGRDEPGTWPGLDAMAPARSRTARHGAILLPFRTLLAAMEAAR